MRRGLIVFLTWFSGTEWLRYEASITHARIPGEAAASAPDATDPWPSLYATLLWHKGLAAGWAVNKHIVEQHPREASKNIHGPGNENNKNVYKMQIRQINNGNVNIISNKTRSPENKQTMTYPLLTTAEWPKRLTSLCRSGLGRSLHSSQAEKHKKTSG